MSLNSNIKIVCGAFKSAKQERCAPIYFGPIVKIIGFERGVEIPAVNEHPTAVELQAFVDSGLGFVIAASFTKEAGEVKEIPAESSESRRRVVVMEEEILNFRVNNINDRIQKMLDILHANFTDCRVVYITEQGYIFGTKTGYEAHMLVSKVMSDENGIAFRTGAVTFWQEKEKSNQFYKDSDFTLVNNLDGIGIYTITNETGLSGDAFIVDDGVTGWNKELLPALYFIMTTATILTAYGSLADRAGTLNPLFTVDTAVNGTVIPDVPGTFGGEITIVHTVVVLANTFTVTYS